MAFINIFDGGDTECQVCGSKSVYDDNRKEFVCSVCGKPKNGTQSCGNGHHVCESCRVSKVYEPVTSICLNSKKKDPLSLAVEIMNNDKVQSQGAEHHYIVPAVLMTCIHNVTGNPVNLSSTLKKAEKLAADTPVNCSFHEGTCGAAIGTGIFLKIFQEREDIDEEKFSLSNDVTALSLQRLSRTHGPRCCKRDTYISLEESVRFLSEKFAIDLPMSEAKCTFSLRNNSCGHEECLYYNMANSLV